MNPSGPTEPESARSRIGTKRLYQSPGFQRLGLADVLKFLESNSSSDDPAVREQIEEFRLLLEEGLDESSDIPKNPTHLHDARGGAKPL